MSEEHDFLPKRSGGVGIVLTILAFVTAGALGGYANLLRGRLVQRAQERDAFQSEVAQCTQARDAEKQARVAAESTAATTAAELRTSQGTIDQLKKDKDDVDKQLAVVSAMTERFRKMIDAGKLQVLLRHGRMVVKMPAGVLFSSGHAELSPDGVKTVTEVARVLKQFPERRFEVGGHTDNMPVRPDATAPFKNNLELSTARALTVANQLVAAGVNPARLSAAGFSEFEPVASNAREVGRQENRRIELVLVPNLTELPAPASPAPPAGPTVAAASPAASPAGSASVTSATVPGRPPGAH
jgi:chemotaxis protein MotB